MPGWELRGAVYLEDENVEDLDKEKLAVIDAEKKESEEFAGKVAKLIASLPKEGASPWDLDEKLSKAKDELIAEIRVLAMRRGISDDAKLPDLRIEDGVNSRPDLSRDSDRETSLVFGGDPIVTYRHGGINYVIEKKEVNDMDWIAKLTRQWMQDLRDPRFRDRE